MNFDVPKVVKICGITTAEDCRVAIDSGAPVLETALDGTGQNIVIRVRTYFWCGVEDWRYWYAANKATS